jgi:addiction module RelE/StbE family toxin
MDDLDAIETYIERDYPAAARRIEQRIKSAVSMLRDRPEIGRPGRVPSTRELVIPGSPYIVPYAVMRSEIVILAVLNSARPSNK